jgi:DNA-binding transcriptional ArsR family regulator
MKRACREMKAAFDQNEEVCGRVMALFQLLSNKTRFRIICLLLRGEFCVGDIVEVVGEGQLSNVSQQLKTLTLAGIIERRRVKRQILYSLKDERLRDLIQYLQKQFLDPKKQPIHSQ